jgi:hypothetical protein
VPSISATRAGDRVVVVDGECAGQRGTVVAMLDTNVLVRIADREFEVAPASLRNFSAAARKAWITRPERAVGRPRDTGPERRTVTLRVEGAIWDALAEAVQRGVAKSREQIVGQALRAWLAQSVRNGADDGHSSAD